MGDGTALPTLLFTDIESSTQLLRDLGDGYPSLLATHFGMLTSAIEDHGGVIAKVEGDGLLAVFATASDAVDAALAAQAKLQAHPWVAPVRVRMGLHTGEAAVHDGEYLGLGIHQAARVIATAHGGQVVASSTTVDALTRDATVTDLGAYALRDFDRPEHLFQLHAPGLVSAFPALRARPAVAHNLPTIRTGFIGRDRELREVAKLLSAQRLVSVVGTGGVGKTRLSFEIARDRASAYFDGATVVLLASVNADRVVATIADAVGVREEAGRPLRDTLLAALARREMLLVLDNCEHVIDHVAALLDDVLDRTDTVVVLTTSRRPLDIPGEAVYHLEPLEPPDVEEPAEVLATNDAVRLFVERAAAAGSFSLDDASATMVAQICRHVDGLPLAIELAAARVRSLPLPALVERLADTAKLLTTGPRSVDERQRTVTALVDWSYDLLTDAEQRLFRRLSVFRGGFDLAAAEAVCGDDLDVVDLLDALVQHSLVSLAEDGRYRVLVVVRDVAAAHLAASDEEALRRDRHLRHFASLAAAQPAGWWAQIGVELDNIRAALAWGLQADGDRVAGTALLLDVWRFFRRRGLASELREWNALVPEPSDRGTWLRLELARLTIAAAPEVAARVEELEPELRARGDATDLAWFQQRRLDAAEATGSTVATLAAVAGDIDTICAEADPLAAARFLHMVSWNSYRSGNFPDAQKYAAQGAVLAANIDDPEPAADFNYLHSVFAVALGDVAATAEYARAAREGYERTGSVAVVQVLNVQAAMHLLAGDLQAACTVYEDTAAASRRAGLRHMEAIALANLADALVSLGRYEAAEIAIAEGRSVADELGLVYVQHLLSCFGASLAYGRGDLDAMAQECERSTALAQQMNTPDTLARTSQAVVQLHLARGEPLAAAEAARAGLANFGDVERGDATGQLAAALGEAGDAEGARREAAAALALPRPYVVMTPRLAVLLAVALRGREAVRLGAAATAAAKDMHLVIPAPERALLERVLGQARREIGDAEFDAETRAAIAAGLTEVLANIP